MPDILTPTTTSFEYDCNTWQEYQARGDGAEMVVVA